MGHGVAEMGEDLIGILATKLPKMGEKEKRKKNYDNQVAEILREEREIFNRNFGMPKKKFVALKIGGVNHLFFLILIFRST